MTLDAITLYFLQEMEMVEKPKKAPEQTAMVKMGMLGIFPIHHCHDSVIHHHHNSLHPHHLHHHHQCHLEGVFMPCLLNIWGVMLFLR